MKNHLLYFLSFFSAVLCNGQELPEFQSNNIVATSLKENRPPDPSKSLTYSLEDGSLGTDNDTVFYFYDLKGNVTFQRTKSIRYSFQYTKESRLSVFLSESLDGKNSWTLIELDSFLYNSSGKEIYAAYYPRPTQVPQKSTIYKTEYNIKGDFISREQFVNDGLEVKLESGENYEYTYDSESNILEILKKTFNLQTSQYDTTDLTRNTYVHDTLSRVESFSFSMGCFVPVTRSFDLVWRSYHPGSAISCLEIKNYKRQDKNQGAWSDTLFVSKYLPDDLGSFRQMAFFVHGKDTTGRFQSTYLLNESGEVILIKHAHATSLEIYSQTDSLVYTYLGDKKQSMASWKTIYPNAPILIDSTIYFYSKNTVVTAANKAALASSVVIYPQPASTVLHVELPIEKADYMIMNDLGEVIFKGTLTKENTLDISGLNSGIHYLRLIQGSEVHVEKIMVE